MPSRSKFGFNVAEAASKVGVGRDHIYGAIRDGRLEARKLGRRTVITYEALERFINELPLLQLPPKD